MDDSTLMACVAKVQQALTQQQLMITTAESCTGGMVAMLLTEMAGSSQWFESGFVTYSNHAKQTVLNVPFDLIQLKGAVSEEVAQAMAFGALQKSQADISLAITGFAGPQGSTPHQPVGTVCFAWANKRTQSILSDTQYFSGDRQAVRKQAAFYALDQVTHLLTQY